MARRLDRALRGAVIANVAVLRADVLRGVRPRSVTDLAGRTVVEIARHGKRLEWRFEPRGSLFVHLGMTGNLLLVASGAPLAPHTHVRISFRGLDREVRFCDPRRFGGLWTESSRSGGRFSGELGPDALDIRPAMFRRALDRRREIKALLLDQRVLAGLGNIYADEALHRAGIHPRRWASQLDTAEVARLRTAIRKVLREAIRAGGSSVRDYRDADGSEGWFQVRHRVYGRAGTPCGRCGAAIRSEVIASRTSHYCPVCQPAP